MVTVLALGAWLKNAACLWHAEGGVAWSPLHGDLATPEACEALELSAQRLLEQAGGRIDAVAHDLHPDFHSTRLAQAIAHQLGVPALPVQHHHAHIGVVMAEQALTAPVIGLALDGVGLGTDGVAWGGELLHVSPEGWQRLGHLQPLALPGGDTAAREPWRMAAAALHAMGRGAEIEPRFASQVGAPLARGVAQMLERELNCPLTTSAGRWFDAAAGALGLSLRQQHEAEAAMTLEAEAARWLATHADPAVPVAVNDGVMDLRPALAECFDAPSTGEAAARFHVALAASLVQAAAAAARARAIGTVVLGGGCFFNRVLVERVSAGLQACGLNVRRPLKVSCGDAGLALGQAWVAAHQLPGSLNRLSMETSPCA